MNTPILSDREKEFVHVLAKMRLGGEKGLIGRLTDKFKENGFDVDSPELTSLLATMESIGAVERQMLGDSVRMPVMVIRPAAISISRSIIAEDSEEDDIVEQAKKTVRKNRVTAPLLILFFVATLAVTFANQLVSFLQNMGWMGKP